MGGAFVGVADDASAVYWNPAGLAGGAYFSLVLDGNVAESIPDGVAEGSTRNSWLLALSMPALGLSYSRFQTTAVRPAIGLPESSRVESLITQNVGATLVHSIGAFVAVGTTIKAVRGIAAAAVLPGNNREALLDDVDLIGHASNGFDLDIGVMAAGSFGKLGVSVRNIFEPSFETGMGEELALQRQARVGGSVILLPGWILAGDVDLLEVESPFGELREVSIGSESRLGRRVTARAGVRFNTSADAAPGVSLGASFAALGSLLVDGQLTGGSEKAFRGWGIAGRFVF